MFLYDFRDVVRKVTLGDQIKNQKRLSPKEPRIKESARKTNRSVESEREM